MGRTGSGKTLAGAWVLSTQNYHKYPFVIVDTKVDDTILNDIGAEEIGINDKMPKHPGLYIVHPLPHQLAELEQFLWRAWQRENIGLMVDEGYMLPNSGPHGRGAFQALLTQGRSKHIPMIVLTQRPAWISRFLFTESDHHMVFRLLHKQDEHNVKQFVPTDFERPLPDYWSRWHNVSQGAVYNLKPVPPRDTLLTKFRDRKSDLRGHKGWATRFISLGQSRTG